MRTRRNTRTREHARTHARTHARAHTVATAARRGARAGRGGRGGDLVLVLQPPRTKPLWDLRRGCRCHCMSLSGTVPHTTCTCATRCPAQPQPELQPTPVTTVTATAKAPQKQQPRHTTHRGHCDHHNGCPRCCRRAASATARNTTTANSLCWRRRGHLVWSMLRFEHVMWTTWER